MRKERVVIMGLLLASNVTLAASPNCKVPEPDPRIPAEVRRNLAMACVEANSATYCEKEAAAKKLTGEAKKDYIVRCVNTATTKAQWQKR